ncbi:hypothetical protein ASG40_04430 [Methylobacterium sp. Leaf399]|nr:hypothetical protein ASF39_19075 [Methylobacterium sp. Leaf108]KQT14582.1 hypothetical protein ASG40_04430 [Methylobacterium sp. Leaf399]
MIDSEAQGRVRVSDTPVMQRRALLRITLRMRPLALHQTLGPNPIIGTAPRHQCASAVTTRV